jgi:DNA replication initiation complex subunit (GINS family)
MTSLITYETIRAAHRAEKSEQLQKLPEGFFSAVRAWFEYKQSKRDSISLLEIDNAKRLLDDLVNRRQRKVVISALHTIRGDMPPEGLAEDEQKFFDSIVLMFRGFRQDMKERLMSYDAVAEEKIQEVRQTLAELKKPEKLEEAWQHPEKVAAEKPLNNNNVKILSDLPAFVGPDNMSYGPFKPGDAAHLPDEIAKKLAGSGALEMIK